MAASKLKYPKRPLQHVCESESFIALERVLPKTWIFRHVTERDYGVDCLVELVPESGDVQGDMCAIQLKSVDILEFSEDPGHGKSKASLSGIAVETVNYWMGLPMPVFLAVYDRTVDRVFVADVKRQSRRMYGLLTSQKTVTFNLDQAFALGTASGLSRFVDSYMQEKHFHEFAAAILDLMLNDNSYLELFGEYGGDCFLEVDMETLIQVVRLYRSLQTVDEFTGRKRPVKSLRLYFDEDKSRWNEPYVLLHNDTLDEVLRDLAQVFEGVLTEARSIVVDEERDFWVNRDPLLVTYCERHDDRIGPEYALKRFFLN